METRNLTLSLPKDLIRQAKVYAAAHDTTINTLVKNLLVQAVSQESRARAAAEHLLALAEEGRLSFKGDPSAIRREDIHKRH